MNPLSPSAHIYLSEVLGIKSYLCPKPIQALRIIKGAIPCRVLAVCFRALSPSQSALLEKIMAFVDRSGFSLLEIKSKRVLSLLLENPPAPLICFFGGPSGLKESLLNQSKILPVSSLQKEIMKKSVFFIQTGSMEELEGPSITALQRKKQLWEELKKWKRHPLQIMPIGHEF